MQWQHVIVYEQPANELLRVCLRLESLFYQIDEYKSITSPYGSKLVLENIIEIINVLDRPDLKSAFQKELARQLQNLQRLQELQFIDHQMLNKLIESIGQLINKLEDQSGKFAQGIRDNEFLTPIRMHMGNPGGASLFDNPPYLYWLHLAQEQRMKDISQWLSEVRHVKEIVMLLLRLVRESSMPEFKTTEQGFFQKALDTKIPCQLVRVAVPTDIKAYPEISMGRHRVIIHFYEPSIEKRFTPITTDISFKLTCCMI